jgi:hypothetical protein
MKYVTEMGSGGKMYMPSFTRIFTGVQAILRFHLSNLRDFNVGFTDERDLRTTPLR